jgi:hypothetical protein
MQLSNSTIDNAGTGATRRSGVTLVFGSTLHSHVVREDNTPVAGDGLSIPSRRILAAVRGELGGKLRSFGNRTGRDGSKEQRLGHTVHVVPQAASIFIHVHTPPRELTSETCNPTAQMQHHQPATHTQSRGTPQRLVDLLPIFHENDNDNLQHVWDVRGPNRQAPSQSRNGRVIVSNHMAVQAPEQRQPRSPTGPTGWPANHDLALEAVRGNESTFERTKRLQIQGGHANIDTGQGMLRDAAMLQRGQAACAHANRGRAFIAVDAKDAAQPQTLHNARIVPGSQVDSGTADGTSGPFSHRIHQTIRHTLMHDSALAGTRHRLGLHPVGAQQMKARQTI